MNDLVAEVLVDTPLAHLDRPFEYTVPAALSQDAQPGVRVRVRFNGHDVDGFLLARKAVADHVGRLSPLRRVVSPERVLPAELATLCRAVADHYAGTMSDVLRLAVPPRHAGAEQAAQAGPAAAEPPGSGPVPVPTPQQLAVPWQPYPAGRALLRHLAAGDAPAAAWSALPDGGADGGWPAALAAAAAATVASGRGAVIVVPDRRDVDRVAAALEAALGPRRFVTLTADLGPRQRYAAWLRALRGQAPVVVGTRAAAYAPVIDVGLLAWWDDGDDLHREARAPYPHVREVLRLRAVLSRAALLCGGFARTTEIESWVQSGSMRPVEPRPAELRAAAPRVVVAGEGHQAAVDAAAASARVPSLAWRVAKEALARGPVLVQVPRRGYLAGVSCQHCRTPMRCSRCTGPLAVEAPGGPASCIWCGAPASTIPCPTCGSTQRRTTVTGERRTAEELGRAFPGLPVRSSRAGQVLAEVPGSPALVVATPGAEPVAPGGYAAALLLDGWALLDRAGLDSGMEAARRWMAAAALTRGGADEGVVVLCGVPPHAALLPVEALVRWAPGWLAARELDDRRTLHLPPVGRLALLRGDPAAVAAAREHLELPAGVEEVGLTGPRRDGSTALVLRGRDEGALRLPEVLTELRAWRSLRKVPGELVVSLDPPDHLVEGHHGPVSSR